MAFRYPATGTFTFDTINGTDADSFLYTDPVTTNATLPQSLDTRRRWCWTDGNSKSKNVGPTSGAGGDPDGSQLRGLPGRRGEGEPRLRYA